MHAVFHTDRFRSGMWYMKLASCFGNLIFEALTLWLSKSQDSPTPKIPPSIRPVYGRVLSAWLGSFTEE